jgi:hypothetical protein
MDSGSLTSLTWMNTTSDEVTIPDGYQVVAGDRTGLWLASVSEKATEAPVVGSRAAASLLGVSHTTINARVRQQAPDEQPGRLGKVGTVWWPSADACRAWWARG